ncbi:MAG: hypothetical protein ABGW78_03030, partial [Pirellulales bacterium]
LLYNQTNIEGKTDTLIKDLDVGDVGDRARRRWRTFFLRRAELPVQPGKPMPHLQFQLLVHSAQELPTTTKDELVAFFLAARQVLSTKLTL